jgi:hypothetical protein
MAQSDNPALPAGLRVFSAIVIVVLIMGGGLFFVPELVKPRWPWQLAPFNARFLGSFYLGEMVAMAALLWWNRWSPARLILVMALAFTLVVTIVSAFHLDHFNFHRKNGWLWFIVYGGSVLASAWFLWRERGTPRVASAVSSAAGWRRYFRVEALAFGVYGLGLLVLPAIFAGFWPWPTDAFHAQVYSAIFLAAGAGTGLLARNAPREELVALGAAQLAIGVLAIAGLIVTDAAVKRINWAAPGTWLWLALLAWIAVAGLIKLRAGMARAGT